MGPWSTTRLTPPTPPPPPLVRPACSFRYYNIFTDFDCRACSISRLHEHGLIHLLVSSEHIGFDKNNHEAMLSHDSHLLFLDPSLALAGLDDFSVYEFLCDALNKKLKGSINLLSISMK